MNQKDVILLRDPDAQRREETLRLLSGPVAVVPVDTVAEALNLLARSSHHALVVRELAGVPDGVAFCRAVHQRYPDIKSVLVTADTTHRPLIEAFNENALFRCLLDPVAPEELTRAVRDAVRSFEMDRVQRQVVERTAEIDRTIHTVPYWLYRLRATMRTLICTIGGSVGLCLLAGFVLLLAGVGVFLLLYYVKSALGIDLFGDRHLKDFIP